MVESLNSGAKKLQPLRDLRCLEAGLVRRIVVGSRAWAVILVVIILENVNLIPHVGNRASGRSRSGLLLAVLGFQILRFRSSLVHKLESSP